MNAAEKYAEDVRKGRVFTGKYIKLAVKRYFQDLERSKKDKKWPYEFNRGLATAYLAFFSTLKHGKGKWRGKPFELMPWAAFIVWNAYGWVKRGSLDRRFMEIYIEVARKNAKTELMAGIGLAGFYMDALVYDEKDPEIYWYATKKDQAKIGWDRQHEMTKMLRLDSKQFNSYCGVSTYGIFTLSGSGKVAYLGKDSDTEDGPSPHYGIGDEKHAHKTDDMENVIRSGMGARRNPMLWDITTAGFNINGPCFQKRKVCVQVLEGSIENDLLFPMIFCLDKEDDWEDKSVWVKANPALPYIDTMMGFLEKEYTNAKTKGGTAEVNFKTKNLNHWTTTQSTWIPDDVYMAAGQPFDERILAGKRCYGGLDLSAKRDLTALALYFPQQDGLDKGYFLWYCWLPKEYGEERQRNDAIPYMKWATEGYIHLTEGNVIDYDYIYQTVCGLTDTAISRREKVQLFFGQPVLSRYKIESVGYDPYRHDQIVAKLIDAGVPMVPYPQNFKEFTPPIEGLYTAIEQKVINHGNNPIARWNFSNVQLRMNPEGFVKFDKDKSSEKIDLVVAAAMAYGIHIKKQEEKPPAVDISFW